MRGGNLGGAVGRWLAVLITLVQVLRAGIRVVDAGRPARSRLIVAVLTDTLGRCRVYHAWQARSVDISSARGTPIWLSVDRAVTTAESAFRRASDRTDCWSTAAGTIEQGAHTDLRVSAGLAGRVIIDTARQTHAPLVVVAARPGMPTMPGTVSQYVLLKALCPVTIVPGEGRDEEPSGDS
ncbi:MAG TPA: universal stress protein [Trebonia sp.]|jgi:nucleotide-binding universal stress UspA family protein|nr:universal stress protein [Trebonia sp.]